VPLWTREHENHRLAADLHYANYSAWPIDYTVVPRDQGRVRLVFHAGNTFEEIDGVVGVIADWAAERLRFAAEGKPWKRDAVLREKL
jgi:8-amino-7-oxononanoate synthase